MFSDYNTSILFYNMLNLYVYNIYIYIKYILVTIYIQKIINILRTIYIHI